MFVVEGQISEASMVNSETRTGRLYGLCFYDTVVINIVFVCKLFVCLF